LQKFKVFKVTVLLEQLPLEGSPEFW